MDYKQKYEQALKYMRKVYPTLNGADKEDAEHYFPELKEGEDERIRKKVIEVLKFNINGAISQMQASRGVDRTFEVYACNKFIAWLKRQGEIIKQEWSEEDERHKNTIIHAIHGAGNITPIDGELAEKWLKSLKQRMKGETK